MDLHAPEGSNRATRTRARVVTMLIVLCMVLDQAGSGPAGQFAYIDPGMGSLLYQAALASVFGLAFYWRRLWVRVVAGLSRFRKPGSRSIDE